MSLDVFPISFNIVSKSFDVVSKLSILFRHFRYYFDFFDIVSSFFDNVSTFSVSCRHFSYLFDIVSTVSTSFPLNFSLCFESRVADFDFFSGCHKAIPIDYRSELPLC